MRRWSGSRGRYSHTDVQIGKGTVCIYKKENRKERQKRSKEAVLPACSYCILQ